MVTWFLVVGFQTPKFNCYIQYICSHVCVAHRYEYPPFDTCLGNQNAAGIVKITICLFFTGVTRQKTFQNFYKPLGAGILCSKRCLLKQRKQTPSRHPVPDHLKYVATSNKITLRTKNSPFQLSDQERNWERKEEILILISHASLILVDIFTWGRSDLVSLVLSCLEFASIQRQVARLSRTILLYWCSFTLCVLATAALVSSGNVTSWRRTGSNIYITMTDWTGQLGADCRW
jgi:hypothetical protein